MISPAVWFVFTVPVWIISIIAGLLGLLGILVCILAIIDPVGAKLADDNDPFGIPPSLAESSGMLLAYIAVTSIAALLPAAYHRWVKMKEAAPEKPGA